MGGSGGIQLYNGLAPVMVSTMVDYRPKNSVVSFLFEPGAVMFQHDTWINLPLNIKFIIGKKFRFCPMVGAFYQTNSSTGFSVGFMYEYWMKDRFAPFLQTLGQDMAHQYSVPGHFGGTYTNTSRSWAALIKLGIKIRLNKN